MTIWKSNIGMGYSLVQKVGEVNRLDLTLSGKTSGIWLVFDVTLTSQYTEVQ